MLRNLTFSLLLLCCIQVLQAQDKQIYIQVGGVLTEPLNEIESQSGFSIGFEAFPGERFSIGPLYSRYPLDNESKDLGNANPLSTMDLDGKYYLIKEKVRLYALAGLALVITGYESSEFAPTTSESGVFLDNRLAANVGAGAMIGLNENLFFAVQTKYQSFKPVLGSPLLTTHLSIFFRLK